MFKKEIFIFSLIWTLAELCRIDGDCGRLQGYCDPLSKKCQCI